MKEILFRVWNGKEYTYDIEINNERQRIYIGEIEYTLYDDVEITSRKYRDMIELEQATGLKDKNGDMIFEGDCFDVVLSSVPPGSEKLYLNSKQYTIKGVVKKAKSGMWVISYINPIHKEEVNSALIYFIENDKEIIGNIHDKNN